MATDGALLDCLAATYRLDLDDGAYVRNVADSAARVLDRGFGVLAYTYDASDPARPVIDQFATSARFDSSWLRGFYAAVEAAGQPGPPAPTGFQTWRHLTVGQASLVPKMRPLLPAFAHLGGSRDTFAVNALDASGRGLWIGAPLRTTRRASSERVALFERFAAHLTAALRLRRNRPTPAAVLSPNGGLLHATDDAVARARGDLRRATLAFDNARTKKMRADVELATRRWRPLVATQWSLLDDFDTDGKHFVLAVQNAAPIRPTRTTLSAREQQVMTQAHLGHSDKVIAYELGIAVSTVRVLLHRATRKLGASSRREAIARFDARTKSFT